LILVWEKWNGTMRFASAALSPAMRSSGPDAKGTLIGHEISLPDLVRHLAGKYRLNICLGEILIYGMRKIRKMHDLAFTFKGDRFQYTVFLLARR
jgi:hypothetical protein